MTTVAVGNRRLLKLADILDRADALHRKQHEPTYNQSRFFHSCGTPACAMGHWATHNPRRWGVDTEQYRDSYEHLPRFRSGGSVITGGMADFALWCGEYDDIFGDQGCDNARTGKQAAKFIRQFVAQRSKK